MATYILGIFISPSAFTSTSNNCVFPAYPTFHAQRRTRINYPAPSREHTGTRQYFKGGVISHVTLVKSLIAVKYIK
ncbi:hypothetical protein DL96DRAFT_1584526 [Flagelloscypha sp. PMI_526]|nr:hypothetical protein DL96DRAFT_1584526 [Flagelloscypha sp. PMI_526]